MSLNSQMPRRRFLTTSALSVMSYSSLLAAEANNKLNIAVVGIGGMGGSNVSRCKGQNVVAICDVDSSPRAGNRIKTYPGAAVYKDFRVMFDKEKSIDAVIVATPDHSHAVVAMAAIARGKHVYVQKPMAHSVEEARRMTEAAREHKVITQMGNQGHSSDSTRQICEWIWDGAIGYVHEVHAWTNRPVWPQSIEVGRPTDKPPVPATLDWNLWIGPAAMRDYHSTYHPGTWRAWYDFGTGSLGDLGCHILNPAFWALKLAAPTRVEANISTHWAGLWKKTEAKNEQYPRSTIVRYQFPARGEMPAVALTWYDGGMMPPRPPELHEEMQMGDSDGGLLFMGDKGILMCGCHGRLPRLLPESAMRAYQRPEPSIPRVPDSHEMDWVRACKSGKPAGSNFDYAGPFTEAVLLGNLAIRHPYNTLKWDSENLQITNHAEANAYVRRNYREGWSI